MSKQTRSKLLNTLLIFGTIAVVLYLGARNGNINDIWNTLITADPLWLLLAFASFCIFVLFEALTTYLFFRFQSVPMRMSTSLVVTLIGLFYSNMTPGSSGGQPMQVLAMKKRGIPSGYTTSALAAKFFCFQTALLLMGVLLWVTHWDFAFTHIGSARWLIYLGFLLNGLGVAGVVLLAINRSLVRGILMGIAKLGHKLRLIKDMDRTARRIDSGLDDFHASVDMLTHRPMHLFYLFLVSCVQVLGLMSIIYFVTLALGITDYSYTQLIMLQFLLFIGVSFTPTPGASGSQEGGFYLLFNQIFPPDKLVGALLIWRFFTYYLSTLISLVFGVLLDSIRTMRGKVRKVPLPKDLKSVPHWEAPDEKEN